MMFRYDRDAGDAMRFSDAVIRDAVARVNATGGSKRAVAREFGMDPMTLHRRARSLGLVMREGQPTHLLSQSVVLPLEAVDLAYLAGIVDGEGSIFRNGHYSERPRWIIEIANTDYGLIEWLLGMGGTVTVAKNPVRPCYHWKLCSRADVAAFLSAVMPYLRIKRLRAQECVDELLALKTGGELQEALI